MRRLIAVLMCGLLPAACASPTHEVARASTVPAGPPASGSAVTISGPPAPGPAVMIAATQPLQCVPYARALSGLEIRGDAWTWWPAAEGRYLRGPTPQVGAVLVLKKTDRLRRGHLAVVTQVLGPRQVLVEHANWLNRGMIHRNVPVVDVSPANDWSEVRLWYVPGNHLGGSVYPAYGFIYPGAMAASSD